MIIISKISNIDGTNCLINHYGSEKEYVAQTKNIQFAYGTIDTVLEKIGSTTDSNINFGYDTETRSGIIVAKGSIVSSKILDIKKIDEIPELKYTESDEIPEGKHIGDIKQEYVAPQILIKYIGNDNKIELLNIPIISSNIGNLDDILIEAKQYTDDKTSSILTNANLYSDLIKVDILGTAIHNDKELTVGSISDRVYDLESFITTDPDKITETINKFKELSEWLDNTQNALSVQELINSVNANKNAINQEIIDRTNAVNQAITKEVNDRNNAINEMRNNIGNDIRSSILLEANDRNAAINSAINALNAQTEAKINTAMQQEIANRNNAIIEATNNINADIRKAQELERSDRDAAINNAISTEIQNRDAAIQSAINQEIANRDNSIRNFIQLLDYNDNPDSNKYVSAVFQTDGVILVRRDDFPLMRFDSLNQDIWINANGTNYTLYGGQTVYTMKRNNNDVGLFTVLNQLSLQQIFNEIEQLKNRVQNLENR